MSIFASIMSVVSAPLTKVASKYIERKTNQDSIKGKARMNKADNSTSITLTDSEWETISKQNENESWKDELATIVILWPMIGIMGGTVWAAFTGDMRLLEGTVAGTQALDALGVDMGELMLIVVISAVSLKWWRKA